MKIGQADKAGDYYRKAISLCDRGLEQLKEVALQRLNTQTPAKQD